MEHRISDNIYKSIFETNLDAILIINPDDKIIDANPAAELLFGYSNNEITKLNISELLDTANSNLSVLLNELATVGEVKGEITFIKKDGSHFSAEEAAIILEDEDDNNLTSMIIRDITDHKQVEDSLIRIKY